MDSCAFENGNECNALTEKHCIGCKFRKTEEELLRGRLKAVTRIGNLPDGSRTYIFGKYYGKRSISEEW